MVFVHRKGVLLYVNRAMLDALGYPSADELLGRHVADVLVAPAFREAIRRCVDQDEGPLRDLPSEAECVRRDGETFRLQGRDAWITFDGEQARVVVARDVTVQR